ncbi:helix-turn-helix domain-containing protein [Xenorhabdus szentirmaii]|uniref:IprA winged helix-turn-helix domain-containing protein n=2 Tax=Xenorhabdus szentirmaii TaxID=290112 RepID=W1IQ92_9GAMM|nr:MULTISPECIES: helix-turn-helix domain-containing protein [Xenorhabdus]MBD2781377.1 helix-turn-helix domain-containing protein [Xenorhabdus sp. 38]MBD2791561.1 helix-turn-helix domain-containing protein [Xenorhabdus sp. CUL]MBD2800554.1 helix-turn-helix domain-containing protein [Xenorhabdus sp. M]MBD2805232.1 helix-turn-helix domain-containing protein [Xenorhabdus sp. ZM]MBD2821762.1 helix-turn-helix domain-containing protein [Xenorhabdus sp. 42]
MKKLVKPVNSFKKVVDALLPYSESITSDFPTQGTFINVENEFAKIFLLNQGYINVHRINDNLIVATSFSPYITGLSFYSGSEIYYSIELGPDCKIYQISRGNALNAIRKHDLHREWMRIVSYKSAFFYARDISIFRHSSKEIVCNLLSRLMTFPDEFRENISAIKYVEQRCTLSRSCIQRILFSLKKEGSIEIIDGCLQRVLKLPSQSCY